MESLLTRDFLVLALKATATVTTSIFVGAATYVNFVEVPARSFFAVLACQVLASQY